MMDLLEILVSAIVRFPGTLVVRGREPISGVASFHSFEAASQFASALEEGFDVDDPEPYTCEEHDDSGWEVEYIKREEL